MIKRPCTRASFIIQTVMCDEASFNVTSVDDLRAKDSPLQACHASILVKSHPESKPQLVNLHCPLQLMRNKRRETNNKHNKKETTRRRWSKQINIMIRRAPTLWSALKSQIGVVLDGNIAMWPPPEAGDLRGLCLGSDGCEARVQL